MFRKVNHVHFVGIGGIGMSGIAELLLNLGFKVSGSDLHDSPIISSLMEKGAEVYFGHDKTNLNHSDVLVYSSAVHEDNPEISAAQENGIPVIKRAEMLGELIAVKPTSIAIGGTHGKTSTTSMIGAVLTEAQMEPTLVVGGHVKNIESGSMLGSGEIIVVEADEFDRSFLALRPTISIVTNIELEHTDCYQNLTELQDAFLTFCNSVPFYGAVVVCADSPALVEILPDIRRSTLTYGLSSSSQISAQNISHTGSESTFQVTRDENSLGEISIDVPGKHNVTNSLAAVTLGLELGIPFSAISRGIQSYSGVKRRFEIKGVCHDVMVVDDYAHHPTEVRATLDAAKDGWNRRIIAVFQPHLFSRTRDFYQDFADSFSQADILIVTDIFPSREEPIEGVSGELVVQAAKEKNHPQTLYVKDLNQLQITLDDFVKSGDMVITIGAGNIWRFCQEYFDHLTAKSTL
ncbi:MAG: UDP-N-acetylmuramate--L-alanine ligase [Candidatus Marinimicrobia bacterium]|jgi:UDP-N-acetylmuramate--alanine ligase|nr:UDP-N-acetylmuramate--L-alanine ligase [Candidatus Neomarinimicrobiota bacterium]